MCEANNSQKPDGQEPVSEKTGGQQTKSERSKGKVRFFTGFRVAAFSLAVIVIGLEIAILYSIKWGHDAIRAELLARMDKISEDSDARIEKILEDSDARMDKISEDSDARIDSLGESLREEIRAGFTSIDRRVVSNGESVDNLCDRDNELNQTKDIEDKEWDERLDSLEKRVSRLEKAQECEG